MKVKQKGLSALEILVVIVVIGLIGTAGWYILQSRNKNISQQHMNSVTETQELMNVGWKIYTSEKLKISFEYPEGWTVREEDEISPGSRIYISNYSGGYDKSNVPDDYQHLWLSTWDQEVSADDENRVKSGSPKCCEVRGPVTATSIKAGSIKMNTYEYQTVGGPKLQVYWTSNGKKYYATNATEIGNQQNMVDTLKKLLPTIKDL